MSYNVLTHNLVMLILCSTLLLLLIQTQIQTAESCMVAGLTHLAQGNVDIRGRWSSEATAAP